MSLPSVREATGGAGVGLAVLLAVAALPVAHTSSTGYDLSYTAPAGAVSDTGVDLVKVASVNEGTAVAVSFETAGAMQFCCTNVYQLYIGGSKSGSTYSPDSYVGDLLSSSNNTNWVEYGYYPQDSSPQLLWILGSMSAGNQSFSVSIPIDAVPAAGNFTLEANAAHTPADPTQAQYTWLGTFLSCWGVGSGGNCASALGVSPPATRGSSGTGWSLLEIGVIGAAVVVVVLVVVLGLLARRRPPAAGGVPPGATGPPPPSRPSGPPPRAR